MLHGERLVRVAQHVDSVLASVDLVAHGFELDEQAFLQVARGDADGIEPLDPPEHVHHVVLGDHQAVVEHHIV